MNIFIRLFTPKEEKGTDDGQNPWAGLASYEDPATAERKLKFCGRDDDSYDVARLIIGNVFVTLYGKSGIGKTSLLNAGVFPELREELYSPLSLRLGIRDDNNSQSYQTIILDAVNRSVSRVEEIDVFPVQEDQQCVDYLWKFYASHRFYDKDDNPIIPVVVLDQFEEVFRNNREEAETLLRQLDNCAVNGSSHRYEINIRFVVSIREDDLYRLEDSIDNCYLPSLKRCRYRLRSLTEQGARDAILIPGEGLFREDEKDQIAQTIIGIARNKEDNSISTNLLSLVCNRLYVESQNAGFSTISLSLVDSFVKGNPFERFFNEATRGFSNKAKSYIEDNFVDSTGRRNSIPESNFLVHVKDGKKLIEGKNRILQRISTSSDGGNSRIELIHDSFCEPLKILKEKRERRKRIIWLVGVAAIALLCLGITSIILYQTNKISSQEGTISEQEKMLISKNVSLEKALKEANDERTTAVKARQEAEYATKEKENTIKELEKKNKALAQLNAQLEREKQKVLDARWEALKNEAQSTAGNASSIVNTDALAASLIALEKLPSNISNPDRPITAEAEALLRNATTSQNRIIEGVIKASFYDDSKKIKINDNIIINTDNGLPVISEPSENNNITTSEEYRAIQDGKNLIIYNDNQRLAVDTLTIGNNLSYFKLSSDGKQLFTSYKDSTNIIWDVKNRTSFVTLKGIFGPVKIVEFNPAKKQLFTATPKMAILWDSETGTPTDTLIGINEIVSVSYSPNGDYVAAASYWNSAPSIIWKTNGGKEVDRYKIDGLYIKTVKFSPDGNCVLLTIQDNTARIWDVSHIYTIKGDIEEKGIHVLDINNENNLLYCKNGIIYSSYNHQPILSSGWLKSASYSHDSKLVAACDDKTIRIWDAISHKGIRDIIGHDDFIRSVSIAPTNDKIASASEDSTIRFWDIFSGKELFKLRELKGKVMFAQYSPDGNHLVSTADSIFRIWDVNKKQILHSHSYEINKPVSFSCDGKQVASIRNDSIIIWNVSSGMQVFRFFSRFGTYTITDMEFSPDGEHILASYENLNSNGENAIVMWKCNSGKRIKTLEGYGPAAFSPNGDSIIVAKYGKPILALLNSKTWERIDSIKTNNSNILKLSFSPNSRYILGMELGGGVTSWDSQGKKKWQEATYPMRWFSHGCFLHDRNYALLVGDDVIIWDINNDKEFVTFERPDYRIYKAAISPNNKYIVTMSYSTPEPLVWNVKTGKRIFSLKHTSGVNHVSFSNDSRYIVTACDDNCALIWDAEKGDTIRSLRNGHTEKILWASFSPDNKYVITASWDKTAVIWNTETGKSIRTLRHTKKVNTASFSKNGKYILTASHNGNTIVWDLETGKQIKTYKSKFSKNALWGPNDNTIITWNDYFGVKVWDFPPLQKLIDDTRKRFKDCQLTPEERRKYYLE